MEESNPLCQNHGVVVKPTFSYKDIGNFIPRDENFKDYKMRNRDSVIIYPNRWKKVNDDTAGKITNDDVPTSKAYKSDSRIAQKT